MTGKARVMVLFPAFRFRGSGLYQMVLCSRLGTKEARECASSYNQVAGHVVNYWVESKDHPATRTREGRVHQATPIRVRPTTHQQDRI